MQWLCMHAASHLDRFYEPKQLDAKQLDVK